MNIQLLSAEGFRQKLAGLADEEKTLPEMEREVIKDEAIKFCSILASLFSDDLDRKTLWERIGTGLSAAIAKASGDFEKFVNFCLDYIKADPGHVAASAELAAWLESMQVKPREWKSIMLRYIETRRFIVLVKARALWNSQKRVARPVESIEVVAPDGFMDDVPGVSK